MGVSVLVSAIMRMTKKAINDKAVSGETRRVNSTNTPHATRASSNSKESNTRAVIRLPHQVEALVIAQGRFTAAAALLVVAIEVLLPDIGRVLALAAVLRIAGAHAADNRRIDGGTRDDHLTFGERGQIVQQIAPHALDGSRHALLVDLIDNTHNTLRLALTQHVGVELAGPLADQAHTYAELAPLRQHLL